MSTATVADMGRGGVARGHPTRAPANTPGERPGTVNGSIRDVRIGAVRASRGHVVPTDREARALGTQAVECACARRLRPPSITSALSRPIRRLRPPASTTPRIRPTEDAGTTASGQEWRGADQRHHERG